MDDFHFLILNYIQDEAGDGEIQPIFLNAH
jgi:hypothetical protein